ncbi:hypothetical protein ACFPYI_17145 [Halomarina salina]|uniref:SCP2 domain-containing protein n=1 Tax=Halomarina salina TaxID=1872699 RepID=A0ABD5RRM6_9EURY|nr:hypothetical protein [Halomarina salina]
MSEATTDVDFERLERIVEADDETFKEELGAATEGLDDPAAIDELLVEHPDAYEALSVRIATVEDPEDLADEDPAALERAMAVLYGGMARLSEVSEDVREAVTDDYAVNWEVEGYDLGWHLETDAESGRIDGGPGLLDDPTLTFIGSLDVMLSMTGDPDFNGPLAFIQNEFEIVGPIQQARDLDSMMAAVRDNARDMA